MICPSRIRLVGKTGRNYSDYQIVITTPKPVSTPSQRPRKSLSCSSRMLMMNRGIIGNKDITPSMLRTSSQFALNGFDTTFPIILVMLLSKFLV